MVNYRLDLDLMVPCPNKCCLAKEGKKCKGESISSPDMVHFGRRVKSIMAGYRDDSEMARLARSQKKCLRKQN